MKFLHLGYWLVLCTIFFTSACERETGGNDDDMMNEDPFSGIGFIFNDEEYETPNAYLIYSDVLQYDAQSMMDVTKIRDDFSFLFTEGTASSIDGTITYSIGTEHSSFNKFRDIGDENVYDDIESVPISTGNYTQGASTTTLVEDLSYPLLNDDVASFQINSIEIDYVTMTGTIDCEYTLTSLGWDYELTGMYVGAFEILVE